MKKKRVVHKITAWLLTLGLLFGDLASPVLSYAADVDDPAEPEVEVVAEEGETETAEVQDEGECVVSDDAAKEVSADVEEIEMTTETPDGATFCYMENPPTGWQKLDEQREHSAKLYYGIYYVPDDSGAGVVGRDYGLYICPSTTGADPVDITNPIDPVAMKNVSSMIREWQGKENKIVKFIVIAGIKSVENLQNDWQDSEGHYNYFIPKEVRSTIWTVDTGVMESIPDWAFSYCPKLLEVRQLLYSNLSHSTVKKVGDGAFYNSSQFSGFHNYDEKDFTDIGGSAFEGCTRLGDLDLDSIINIGNSAFYRSGLEILELRNPENIQTIGWNALKSDQLDYINLWMDRSEYDAWALKSVIPDTANIRLERREYIYGRDRVQSIAPAEVSKTISRGNTYKIKVNFTPSYVKNEELSYSVTNSSVASVGKDGTVTGIGGGTTEIKIRSEDTDMKRIETTFVLTVNIPVTGVTISPKTITIKDNETAKVTATVLPNEAGNRNVTYTSSNTGVATVAADGTITAHKEGTTTITAKTAEGGFTDTCAVTVLSSVIPVTSVICTPTTLTLKKGETGTITASVLPADATNKNVRFSSSNEGVAKVSSTGVVTASGAGTATITVTSENGGKTATCAVTVKPVVEGVTISPKTLTLFLGEEGTVQGVVTPSNAENKAVSYESSDPTIASVSAEGKVTGLKAGSTTITVKTNEGGYTDTCTVTVKNIPVSGVTLSPKTMTLEINETGQLTATVSPENAGNKNVSYKSSNASVATVTADGLVTAVKAGTATITVTTEDGRKTDTCAVTVKKEVPAVTGVTISLPKNKILIGETVKPTIVISPTGTGKTFEDYTVTADNDNVTITTDSEGYILTGAARGSSVITVAMKDNATIKATCNIDVIPPVSGLNIELPKEQIYIKESIKPVITILPEGTEKTYRDYTVTASNTNVTITVNGEGYTIHGAAIGTSVITVAMKEDPTIKASCNIEVVPDVSDVTIELPKDTIKVGDTITPVITILPEGCGKTYKDYMLEADNDNVNFLVNKEGYRIYGRSEGITTITVKMRDYDLEASCSLTIAPADTEVSGIFLTPNTINILEEEETQIALMISPADATVLADDDFAPVLVSTSEAVVVENEKTVHNGNLWTFTIKGVTDTNNTAVRLNATVHDPYSNKDAGGKDYTASSYVRVQENVIELESIDLNDEMIEVGEEILLIPTMVPENATVKSVFYSSNHPDVATVDSETGLVKGVSEGVTTITAIIDSKRATCEVKVVPVRVKSVVLTPKDLEMTVGDEELLHISVSPNNATYQTVTYKNSDPAVVEIDEATGKVKALAEGTAEIRVEVNEIESNKVVIRVAPGEVIPVESITLAPKKFSLSVNGTRQLVATIEPENASFKDVTYYSFDESVCTVSETGLVTAVAPGNTIVVVVTNSGNCMDSCEVTVQNTDVDIPEEDKPDPNGEDEKDTGDDTYDDLVDAEETRIVYLVKGQKVRVPGCTVTSNDNKVVAASKLSNGYTTLTAKKNGMTTINVTSVSGNTLSHIVFVESPMLSSKSVKMIAGTDQAFSTNMGSNTDNYITYYSSNNQDVAYVAEGRLYAISKGKATITANVNGKRYNCKVTVKDPAAPKTLDGVNSLTLAPNQTVNIKFKNGFKMKDATWTISANSLDPVIAMKGSKITAVGVGKVTLIGTDTNGFKKELNIEVKPADIQTMHLNTGRNQTAKFYKLNNKNATWTSCDTAVAVVEDGKIKAVHPGSTMVTAVCGNFTYITNVTVEEPSLTVSGNLTKSGNKYALTMLSDGDYQLDMPYVSQVVGYSSTKPEIARVNNHGRVIACSAGKTKLTAKVNGTTVTVVVNVFDKSENGSKLAAEYVGTAASYEYREDFDYKKEFTGQ